MLTNDEIQRFKSKRMKLLLITLPLDEANAFVARHHRHHKPVIGHKFSIGPRVDKHPLQGKLLWEAHTTAPPPPNR